MSRRRRTAAANPHDSAATVAATRQDGVEGLDSRRPSRYGPEGFRPAEPPPVRWTVRYVDADSEEGRSLRAVQAAAFRRVLECQRDRDRHLSAGR